MATPRIPNDFKPLIRDYSIGAPDGVAMTDVAGGMPRVAPMWDRGNQAFSVALMCTPERFMVWSAWFLRVIRKGAYRFVMPLDSGLGMEDHTCQMIPGTYSATRANGSQNTVVTFQVLAESTLHDLSVDEAESIVDFWNGYGGSGDALLDRIAQFANVDSLVLQDL